jgi:cytochrome b561
MSRKHYHTASIFFHWLIFTLVILALGVIELKGQFPRGSEPRELCKTVHSFLGQLIFIAMFIRLCVRLKYGVPEPLNLNKPLLVLAKGLHWTFYLLLLTLPIMGFIFLQAGGKEVHFLSWVWPELISPNPDIKKIFKESHEWLGNALYFLIGLHALAGLWHHYLLKDDTLRRMLNKIKPSH